jgi:hypothetical protein
MARREIPYSHLPSTRNLISYSLFFYNKYPTIKRILHVIEAIYNLFHKPSKRERILYDAQSFLEQQLLEIPDTTEVRWLSSFRAINAAKLWYSNTVITCKHFQKDGANLASMTSSNLLMCGYCTRHYSPCQT